jgi:Trp operon repressor
MIKGNVKDPKTSGWTTFVGILKNAFVQAFHESLTNEIRFKEPASTADNK